MKGLKLMDEIARGTSMDGKVRIFSAVTTDLVNEAQKIHHTYPVSTAALGRLLTGAAMMGAGLKNDTDSITLQIKGDGPIGSIVAVTDAKSNVRGYVVNPFVERPLNDKGKLDVGGAVGNGFLNVVRDLGMKEPYVGQVPLVSGEIAEDLTYYYVKSEQIPTAIGLGVLVDTDNSVIAAGGFMIQLMPGADEGTIQIIEDTVKNIPAVTTMIKDGMNAEDILFRVSEGLSVLIQNEKIHPEYKCKCSRDRMEKALISIGKDELEKIIKEDGKAELSCHFCNNAYTFSKEELENLLEKAK